MGRRRRALVRDQADHFAHTAPEAINVGLRDLKNRSRGMVAATRRWLVKSYADDSVLSGRIRSELGFLSSHPSSIEVTVDNGVVTLRGPILEHEVDRMLQEVGRIEGVKAVENRLEVYESGAAIPGLQGEPSPRTGRRLDILQSNWAPATRLLAGTAAGAFLLYAASRRDASDAVIALLSTAVLARALTNVEFKRLISWNT